MSDQNPRDPSGWPAPSADDAWRPTPPQAEPVDEPPAQTSPTADSRYTMGPDAVTDTWSARPANPWASPRASQPQSGPTDSPAHSHAPQYGYDSHTAGQASQAGEPGQPAQGAYPSPSAYASFPQAGSPSSTKVHTERERRGAPGWLALLVAMLITALVSVGGTMALVGAFDSSSSGNSGTGGATSVTPPVTSSGDTPDWAAVAEAVSPATVTIVVQSGSSGDVGSGVIYDASGHIVTNYHVISAASGDAGGQIQVTLADGRVFNASIVGSDPDTDLAVIQLENAPGDLTVAAFGSSSTLVVGQDVMAIGAPLGLSSTVTTGIISALNRPVAVSVSSQPSDADPNDPFGQLPNLGQQQTQGSNDQVITNAIQVDASINPGNSGGPLFDASGSVIGINSSIASMAASSDTAGSVGLGFAIPSDLVKSVADQLISTGSVDHALLGVSITNGTAQVQGTARVGAEVKSVTPGSSADQAGLREDDVVLTVDGNAVTSGKSLSGYIRRYTGGDTVTIEYARDGQIHSVEATLQSK